MYPDVSKDLAQKRRELAPEIYGVFRVAHVTQCPYCFRGRTERAMSKGANEQEIMEAIWVAAEMRTGGAYAHSHLAIDAMHRAKANPGA